MRGEDAPYIFGQAMPDFEAGMYSHSFFTIRCKRQDLEQE